MASWAQWWGGTCYSARLIVPVVPFLFAPLPLVFESRVWSAHRLVRWLGATLMLASIGCGVIAAFGCDYVAVKHPLELIWRNSAGVRFGTFAAGFVGAECAATLCGRSTMNRHRIALLAAMLVIGVVGAADDQAECEDRRQAAGASPGRGETVGDLRRSRHGRRRPSSSRSRFSAGPMPRAPMARAERCSSGRTQGVRWHWAGCSRIPKGTVASSCTSFTQSGRFGSFRT